MSKHKCAAWRCHRQVPLSMLMCRSHWYTLPQHLRDAIWREYIPGQEHNLADVSLEYEQAVAEAVTYLNRKEGFDAQGEAQAQADTGA